MSAPLSPSDARVFAGAGGSGEADAVGGVVGGGALSDSGSGASLPSSGAGMLAGVGAGDSDAVGVGGVGNAMSDSGDVAGRAQAVKKTSGRQINITAAHIFAANRRKRGVCIPAKEDSLFFTFTLPF